MDQATIKILYNNKDITTDISESLEEFTYADKTSGEADELTIRLHNIQGLWGLEWYPEKGAELQASIIQGTQILECGKFFIDQLQLTGNKSSGDTVTIKGLSTGIKQGVRTIVSHANENKTLKQIATSIAAKYGWKVQGNIPDIKIGRTTQTRETDLHYLARIASQFGMIFSVRADLITFTSIFDLENKNAALTLQRRDITSWDITDKTLHVYIEAISSHYNVKEKKIVQFITPGGKVIPYATQTTGNFLNIKSRAENEQQADLISKAAIYQNNSLQQEGSVSMPGNIIVVAGINIIIEQLGRFSGNYHVVGSTHTVNKSNSYVTNAEIKRVGVIALERMKENENNDVSYEGGGN